ncbi:uncharacterized protein LOC108597604 isoform X9 [Drosophila busckii]|uniref:uncharacterized protein LOC108597604 isoform X9 n=1 Tax=Drosophila busckii TaxID=30019 RepID=UPI00083E9C94|nr:uncharacterized protein LOC108597604 isoform X9 [Drosophila busckii]
MPEIMAMFTGLFSLLFCCMLVCFCLRLIVWICYEACQAGTAIDRQNTAELGRQHNNYADIFYIEPNSPEAARIREQLEKDDKELPSYDEVMRMCNLTSPTAAAAPTSALPAVAVTPMDSGPIGIAALPAPPYSELDPHTSPVGAPVAITISALETAPSTSRAAQTPT